MVARISEDKIIIITSYSLKIIASHKATMYLYMINCIDYSHLFVEV